MRVSGFGALTAIALLSPPAATASSGSSYTIEDLRALARSAHPTLAAVEAAIEEAEGLLRQARAYPNPDLALSGGRGEPRDGGASRSESSLELAQPIEMPGVRKWRARVAELGLDGAEIERAVAASAIDASVSRLAYTVLAETRRVEIAQESSRIAGRFHELLARRVELGESSPFEAVKAHAEWFARRRGLLEATGALDAARSALNLLCGDRLGGGYEVVDAPEPSLPPDLPADLVGRMRAGNPVLARAEIALRKAEAGVESERRGTLPQIDLVAGHDTELDRTATSVRVGLKIPLWNRNRGAVEAATAHRRRAAHEMDALLVDLETELSLAATEYRRARAAIALHAEGWNAAAEEALRIATFRFENGEAGLLEVLDAQRSNVEVRLAETDARAALRLARAEIERLIGGPIGRESDHEAR
jgi:cobalt-zinc-cadmium efflux system outer membrane protein